MRMTMQNTESGVFIACDGYEVMVREGRISHPDEKPVLGQCWRHDETLQATQLSNHPRSRLDMSPPKPPICLPVILGARWPDIRQRMGERRCVVRSISLAHLRAEVDDPGIRRAARYVHAICPRQQYIGVRAAVRIDWCA